jgi:hypothetical protein
MSYFPFNSNNDNPDKFNPEKMNKKVRFENTEKKDFYCDTPGFWKYEKKWDVIQDETNLITPGVGTRQKTQIQMTETLHPNNYSIPVQNKLQKETDEKVYFPGYDTGPGRGFGNLSISNDIRIGDFTRTETKNFKAKKETEVIDRWQFIDNRYQNPSNLVMPIPRGGETTRKNNNEPFVIQPVQQREFTFKY